MLMETTRKCPAHSKIFRILVSSSSKSYELIECQRISYYWRRRERQALVNLLFIYLFIYFVDIDPVDGVTMLNRCSVLDHDIEVRVRKALLPFQSADVVLRYKVNE